MVNFSDLIPIPQQVSPSAANMHGYTDPTPPGSADYEKDHELVEKARLCVLNGTWPSEIFAEEGIDPALSPLLKAYLGLSEQKPKGCADVVQMDHPFDIWDLVVQKYIDNNNIKLKTSVFPSSAQGIPFVEGVEAKALAHMLIAAGLRRAFQMKAALDQLRPAQHNPAGDDIQQYPHPAHPEKPAGHGAFCGAASKAFEVLYDGNAQQISYVKTATQQFAMFRTMAGMHIPSSNQLGWQAGYDATAADVQALAGIL